MSAKQYRKKPVVIEAWQFTEQGGDAVNVVKWCGGTLQYTPDPNFPSGSIASVAIKTLEGTMVANFGDYIIKGVKGEFYPCKPNIFAATYDSVDNHDGDLTA